MADTMQVSIKCDCGAYHEAEFWEGNYRYYVECECGKKWSVIKPDIEVADDACE